MAPAAEWCIGPDRVGEGLGSGVRGPGGTVDGGRFKLVGLEAFRALR